MRRNELRRRAPTCLASTSLTEMLQSKGKPKTRRQHSQSRPASGVSDTSFGIPPLAYERPRCRHARPTALCRLRTGHIRWQAQIRGLGVQTQFYARSVLSVGLLRGFVAGPLQMQRMTTPFEYARTLHSTAYTCVRTRACIARFYIARRVCFCGLICARTQMWLHTRTHSPDRNHKHNRHLQRHLT